MKKTSENLYKLIEDFISTKVIGKMLIADGGYFSEDDVNLLFDEAFNYADNVGDYWPDHQITVTFEPELKDEI